MKQRFLAALLVLAALGPAAGSAKADYLNMSDFGHSIKLMVDGYTGSETLTNFPVLVRVSETRIPGFLYTDLTNNKGADIAFFDELGNHLASEIETNSWKVGDAKDSQIWVRLPRMTQGTKFYMCYNTSESGVWVTNANPWTDYVGVWHLDESGKTGKTIYDSTTNVLNGLTYAGEGRSAGAVGKARKIAGDNAHAWGIVVNVLDDPVKKTVAESLDTDFHASFWMLANSGTLNYGTLLCRRKGDQGYSWMVAFGGDNKAGQSVDYLRVNSNNPNSANIFTEQPIGSFLKLNNSVWKKVDVVWKYATNGNDPAVDIYTNGVIAETIASTRNPNPVLQEDANIGIGGSTQPNPSGNNGYKGRRFNGSMDEVRLRPGSVSADWVKADFDTVNNPNFVVRASVVTWDVGTNGGTMVVDGATISGTYEADAESATPVPPATPTKTDAFFVGWNTDPDATAGLDLSSFVLSGDTTFYAIFADARIAWFDADGTSALDPATTFVAAGERPSHAAPAAPKATLYDRYTFEGWTLVGGDGTIHAADAIPVVSAGDDIAYKAVFDVEHTDDPDPSLLGFEHDAILRVAGYTGGSAVADFPVLVRISAGTPTDFAYSQLQSSDGDDFAFFGMDGEPLAFDVDTWNPAGESLVWVRLPSMQNGTRFQMHWGSTVHSGKEICTGDVWSGFTGVWHLNEAGDGVQDVEDSTANELDAKSSDLSAAKTDGAVGAARQIVNGRVKADKGVKVTATASALDALDALGANFSVSWWMRPVGAVCTDPDADKDAATTGIRHDAVIGRKATTTEDRAWQFQLGDHSVNARVWANETDVNQTAATGDVLPLAQGEWTKVDLIYAYGNAAYPKEGAGDVGNYVLFTNGVEAAHGDFASVQVQGSGTLSIGGGFGNGERPFWGDMDEVRIIASTPPADRVLADYETVADRTFLENDILAVLWSAASGTTGFERIGALSAVVGGTVAGLGTAASCDIVGKIWTDGEEEPSDWTTLTNGIDGLVAFSVPVTGLSAGTAYRYALRAVGNDGGPSRTVSGSFTTTALVVEWFSATASPPGLSRIALDFVTASGAVSALGDATACDIQAKVWLAGGEEPTAWTTVAENLALGASFNATIRETSAGGAIAPGTAYAYALRGVGNDGEATALVSGTFTTGGDPGEEIGSEWTHFFDDGTNAYWVAKGFERYLQFTVDGYTGTEVLTNFPVLVDVRANDEARNGFTYRDFYRADGSDMAFVDETGHLIPHEIDTWNRNGMSLIWVRLPRMVNGTTFTMCYRSPLLEPLPDVGNTFERYVGVWHMNEIGDGVVSLKDSTTNALPGESHPNSLEGVNEGQKIGGNARRVAKEPGTSSSNGNIIVFDHDDILRTGVGNVFTFSGWYKTKDKSPRWAYLVDRKIDDFSRGWGVQFNENDSNKLRVWSDPKGNKGAYQAGKVGGYHTFAVTGYSHETWAYWTFVFSNDTFHAYLDGAELASTVGGFKLAEPFANDATAEYDNLVIGGQQLGTGAFNGWVDEARYSKGVRSADWIKAEYDSTRQKDVAFVAKGDRVGRGVESLVPVVVWERGDDLPDTVVDVSYAYVQFAGTVTFCGSGADECRIEYQLWADGEEVPGESDWEVLLDHAEAGTAFSIPVTGLKQDMPYNFRIRAVNEVGGREQANREHSGSFRTIGNAGESGSQGDLLRVDNRFCHRYKAGVWTFTTPDYVTNVEILVVGGGGAGGYKIGGGGGGGGLFYSESFPVATNTTYRIHVGRGGTAPSNTVTEAKEGNGEYSYFALLGDSGAPGDETNPLILVPGGGGGGSYAYTKVGKVEVAVTNVAAGADGASGGGGTWAMSGGNVLSNEVNGVWTVYGHAGGCGNDSRTGANQLGKTAAGGGGGAGRAGINASFDSWYGGGAGGVGVENSATGERLFYGAGGGGGYAYRFDNTGNYSKPGRGGSGIGGDAADLRNGTPATSGVDNTGAGGGGGSMILNNQTDKTFWQGGDGGDGVVLISYEVHGRDPISEDPCIAMTRCDYDGRVANIRYRAYWAGIQAETNDLFVLYCTSGEEDLRNGVGELVRIATGAIGVGDATFAPPAVGFTYWLRLVARKDANSYMYSDEIASFDVPAVELNGTNPRMPDENDFSKDYAEIAYNLFDTASDARLYCYWSENRSDLEGDAAPSGGTVRFLDLGTGLAGEGRQFVVKAEDGLERNKTYWVRLATGNEAGTKYFLSDQILLLEMVDKPRVVFDGGSWSNHVATVSFLETTAALDPAAVDLLAVYSGVEADVKAANPLQRAGVRVANLGPCSWYPDGETTATQFPMWSTVKTNFYVRLALATNLVTVANGVATTNPVPVCWSQRHYPFSVNTVVVTNMLLVFINPDPKTGCYGDERQPLTYTVSYGGRTEGPGWDHWNQTGNHFAGALDCAVNSLSPTGQYDIVQGTFDHSHDRVYTQVDPVIDPDTGEQAVDPVTGNPLTVSTDYYYEFVLTSSKYIVTNAQFSVSIADARTLYTGEPFNNLDLRVTTNGLRNAQPVTFQYRVGTNEWSDTIGTTYSDIWTHIIQFKASAPNHGDARGTFMVTIDPAPLTAEISAPDLFYDGTAQVPAVTTNVTGLMRSDLNPLTCEFRDDAGEWQSEVPSFELPGTYTLWFRASAPNHVMALTNCTFTIEGWNFLVKMDNGSNTTIRVTDPGWFIRNTDYTGEQLSNAQFRYEKLDERCANGLKLWQNYVIERKIDDALVAAIHQACPRVAENHFEIRFPNVNPLGNTGLAVDYRLDRRLAGEAAFSEGPHSDKYEMNVPLGPSDPTGLYVFNIVLSTTNDIPWRAVLPSCATVGVLRVTSPATNAVVAVPWMSMVSTNPQNEPVEVSETVNPNGISAGDRILAYNTASNFQGWAHASGTTWNPIPAGETDGVAVVTTNTTRFARGGAFWLVRTNPGECFYLIGRYTGDEYTAELAGATPAAPGYTLVANPTMAAVALDDLVFVDGSGDPAAPADGDRIVVQDAAGFQKVYVRDAANEAWGRYVSVKSGGRVTQSWESGAAVEIPAGTGFWYVRTDDDPLAMRFGGAE